MAVERPILTPEQYARAERREGIHHPVVAVIDQHLPAITQIEQGYSAITVNQDRFIYINQNYGFLADALVEAGSYTLDPEDLITIWSRAREVFSQSRYQRYALAGMVASAYAIQGVENLEWTKFPRHYLETSELPEGVTRDRSGLLHVSRRLDEIGDSLDELNRYVFGTKESGMTLAANLAKRSRDGDPDADRQLEELFALEKARQTPLLGDIHENFGNGYVPLRFPIEDALKQSE